MKKIYTLALLLSATLPALAAWDGTSASVWTKGDGSETNPFIIENEQQLIHLQQTVTAGESYEGKYFRLENDLDFSGKTTNPIGYHDDYTMDGVPFKDSKFFLGSFDGNYRTIDNVRIVLGGDDSDMIGGIGLFAGGRKSTTVRNLIVGSEVTVDGEGSVDVGGIMGISYGSTIENCAFVGNVKGGSMESGGIVGGALEGTDIKGCVFCGDINGYSSTAGIVGYLQGSSISDCLSAGAINGNEAYYIGGIAGVAERQSTISRCVSISPMKGIAGSQFLPGISPVVSDASATTITDCYYAEELCGCKPLSAQTGVNGVTSDELKGAAVLAALNAGSDNATWTSDTDGYPMLSWLLSAQAGVTDAVAAQATVVLRGNEIIISADHAYYTIYDIAGRKVDSGFAEGHASSFISGNGVFIAIVTDTDGASSVFKLSI